MLLKQFVFNDFQENTFLIYQEAGDGIVVDPGFYYPDEVKEFDNFIKEQKLKVSKIINTHGHFDHIFGVKYLQKNYHVPFYIHDEDKHLIEHATELAQVFGFENDLSISTDYFLKDKDEFYLENSLLQIIHLPGHSPGGVGIYAPEEGWLIAGDTLFQGSIGRTDLPGGDFETLIYSIQNRLFVLPDSTKVYAGHGPSTTIKYEKMNNPFLK